jgi:predicted phosphodiesterase
MGNFSISIVFYGEKESRQMGRTILIGDVHGMDLELDRLLGLLQPTQNDTVVFVGDLVDKGPNSPRVVQTVRRLQESTNVVVVEGNHEEKHRKHRKNLQNGRTRPGPVNDITEQLTDDDVEFMDGFVPFHRIPEHNILVVHGGVPGNWTSFPSTVEELNSLSKRKQKRYGKVSRTRHVCKDTGKFRCLNSESPSDPFWSDVYDGRFGHVVFGHEPQMDGPQERQHSTGIDTGCVFGGSLTGLVLNPDGTRHYTSVPGRKFRDLR